MGKGQLDSKARRVAAAATLCLVVGGERNCAAAPSDAAAADASPPTDVAPSVAPRADSDIPRAPLLHELGVGLSYQAPLSLDKAFGGGGGVSYTLHYLVSSRSALGVTLSARAFPTEPWHVAIGYGLTFTHHLLPRQLDEKLRGWFFRYGLLMQMNVLQDRGGTATGHDTLLAVGYDFPGRRAAPYLLFGYHLTQVRAFDAKTLWWPYTDLVVGVQFR